MACGCRALVRVGLHDWDANHLFDEQMKGDCNEKGTKAIPERQITMASEKKQMRRNEERIKQAIVAGHQRGVCDSSGNSVLNEHGILVAKPRIRSSAAKTYVFDKKKGKLVEKKDLTNKIIDVQYIDHG